MSDIQKLREARDKVQAVLDAAIFALDNAIFTMDEVEPVVPIVTSQPVVDLQAKVDSMLAYPGPCDCRIDPGTYQPDHDEDCATLAWEMANRL